MAEYDEVGQMMAYEQGELGTESTIELFQRLINTGLVWQLQGSYGRTALSLIKAGVCRDVRRPRKGGGNVEEG